MESEQVREWAEAQKIAVSIDLVEAAKTHLKFLTVIDRNRFLYEDHALERAIYRYNVFWLPLLVKHLENPVSEETLVVPLDCELIWHCHRLNPVRFKFDCEKLFGRVLGNHKVISSIQAASTTTTKKIWNNLYPEEPYELDLNKPFTGDILQQSSKAGTFTSYDLVSAVKRQIPFTFEVSRPHMSDDLFLQEALARYKGFLHLIKTNQKLRQNRLCVPTYDIDLIWHTHQLHPDVYNKDMNELVGYVVQHNDNISEKTAEKKLQDGLSETTKHWEQIFGFSYWKAGAMSRGSIPDPVMQAPYDFNAVGKEFNAYEKCSQQFQFATVKVVEVLLEFVDIKNLPEEHKENLVFAFSKNDPDMILNTKRSLGISSDTKQKLFAMFQCEPKGELLFELMSYCPAFNDLEPKKSMKLLGSCSLSFEELLSRSQLSANKWVPVDLVSGLGNSEPVLLHVSISFTPPTPAPQMFRLVWSEPMESDLIQTNVMDDNGKKLFSLQKRIIVKDAIKCTSDLLAAVDCIANSGEKHALIEFNGTYWSVKGTHGSFNLQNSCEDDDSLFELVGHKMVKLFRGIRLDFELAHCKNEKSKQIFLTAVEFSADYPYGKVVALINSKTKTIKVIEEWPVLPGIALAFILSDWTTKDGGDMVMNGGNALKRDVKLKTADCGCEPCNENGDCKLALAGAGCIRCVLCGSCGNSAGVNKNADCVLAPAGAGCIRCVLCGSCGNSGGVNENADCVLAPAGAGCIRCVLCGSCDNSAGVNDTLEVAFSIVNEAVAI